MRQLRETPWGETTADHTTTVAGRLVQQSGSTQHLITIDSTNLDNPGSKFASYPIISDHDRWASPYRPYR